VPHDFILVKTMDSQFKVIISGNCGVGKTSLLVRFVDDAYTEGHKSLTINADFKTKVLSNFNSGGKDIKLTIFDTAGQEKFRTITSSFYRGAAGAMLVYDISSRDSFDAMQSWIEDTQLYLAEVPRVIIGNKLDLASERDVKEEEGEALAKRLQSPFFETSCKTGENVEEAFFALVRAMQQEETRLAHPRVDTVEVGGMRGKKKRCEI